MKICTANEIHRIQGNIYRNGDNRHYICEYGNNRQSIIYVNTNELQVSHRLPFKSSINLLRMPS